MIPKGWKGSGWAIFVRKMRELVGLKSSSSVMEEGREVLNRW